MITLPLKLVTTLECIAKFYFYLLGSVNDWLFVLYEENIMGIEISKVHHLISDALDYRAIRQDMIASNIANADTPYYKPRDISFESALAEKKADIFKDNSQQLQLAQTDKNHIPLNSKDELDKPTTFFRDGHMARNDGNSVDIDVETTEMSKNSIMFNALIQANKKEQSMFQNVISASQKLQ